MFRKSKPDSVAGPPLERVRSIAEKAPPQGYSEAGAGGGRAKRRSVFKQAIAILPHGERLPIAIKSLSETGLRVDYFQNRPLPGRMIVTEASVPLRLEVELVWQGDQTAGLRIIRDLASSAQQVG